MCSSLGPPSRQTSFTTASMNSKFKLAITDTFSNKSPCQVYDVPNATPSQKEKNRVVVALMSVLASFLLLISYFFLVLVATVANTVVLFPLLLSFNACFCLFFVLLFSHVFKVCLYWLVFLYLFLLLFLLCVFSGGGGGGGARFHQFVS